MVALLTCYARVSTDEQDLTANATPSSVLALLQRGPTLTTG
jgi:hypothetical protein